MKRSVPLWTALLLGGCGFPYTPRALPLLMAPDVASAPPAAAYTPPRETELAAPVTILISIDGFRPDYLDRGVTPTLSALARNGVVASMRPSFPSKTFPNHWAIATGLRPDRNGVVGNTMEDPARPGETFTMATDDPFWWSEAEPIWVTAERAGVRTATEFWPGANVGWGGTLDKAAHGQVTGGARPSDWHQFNGAVTGDQRVDAVLDWMRRPAATRPRFVTLYFDTVDSAGHRYGPDDARTTAAAGIVDAEIKRLVDGLNMLGQPANLVIVADHGMAATSSDRVVPIDRLAPPGSWRAIETGPYASLAPTPGHEATLAAALLRPHPHVHCWRKGDVPARLYYGANPRVPPFLCLADTGWEISRTAPTSAQTSGDHGYDNDSPEMRALFIAEGPAFVAGQRLPAFDNLAVDPLLRHLLGLPQGIGLDGDDTPFRTVLKR